MSIYAFDPFQMSEIHAAFYFFITRMTGEAVNSKVEMAL